MIETAIFLFLCALCTLPSLISYKKEEGRDLLGKVIFVQGGIGVVIFVVSLVTTVSVGIAGAESIINSRGIVFWMTLLVSNVVVVCLGFILSFGLIQKLVTLRASLEARERAEALFHKLIEFQTPAGFICLVTGIWVILYETVIFPLIRI